MKFRYLFQIVRHFFQVVQSNYFLSMKWDIFYLLRKEAIYTSIYLDYDIRFQWLNN